MKSSEIKLNNSKLLYSVTFLALKFDKFESFMLVLTVLYTIQYVLLYLYSAGMATFNKGFYRMLDMLPRPRAFWEINKRRMGLANLGL